MGKPTFWLDLFTGKTWHEFVEAGASVNGFRESRWATVKRIRPGDYLLCYLTGVSRFIGVLEVISEPYRDTSPIWQDEEFPCRLKTKVVVVLTPETAVPISHLKEQLSIFQHLTSPHAWTGRVRGSPSRWKELDGEAVLQALLEAKANPVPRPVDPKKLARRPKALKAKIGTVTVPETDDEEGLPDQSAASIEPTEHTEIQYLLLNLGAEMGFDVWVARNDRNRLMHGQKFSDRFNLKDELPLQFDEVTTKTIEYIDVLWLANKHYKRTFSPRAGARLACGVSGRAADGAPPAAAGRKAQGRYATPHGLPRCPVPYHSCPPAYRPRPGTSPPRPRHPKPPPRGHGRTRGHPLHPTGSAPIIGGRRTEESNV